MLHLSTVWHVFLLVAQQANEPTYSVSWALVLLCVVLGLLVTLASSRRTTEIKRSRDE